MDQTAINVLLAILNYAIEAAVWMAANPLYSGPILVAEYVLLMKGWAACKGEWWEPYYKIAAGGFFIPQDLTVNWTLATLVFADIPDTAFELVTARFKRYKRNGGQSEKGFNINWDWMTLWRLEFSLKSCRFLNKYDPDHC